MWVVVGLMVPSIHSLPKARNGQFISHRQMLYLARGRPLNVYGRRMSLSVSVYVPYVTNTITHVHYSQQSTLKTAIQASLIGTKESVICTTSTVPYRVIFTHSILINVFSKDCICFSINVAVRRAVVVSSQRPSDFKVLPNDNLKCTISRNFQKQIDSCILFEQEKEKIFHTYFNHVHLCLVLVIFQCSFCCTELNQISIIAFYSFFYMEQVHWTI